MRRLKKRAHNDNAPKRANASVGEGWGPVTGSVERHVSLLSRRNRSAMVETTWAGSEANQQIIALDDYEGLAATLCYDPERKEPAVFLQLCHKSAGKNILLSGRGDVESVGALWLSMARKLRLPLLVVDPKGRTYQPAEVLGSINCSPPADRRKNHVTKNRRSRFAKRRQNGLDQAMPVFDQSEIIARR